MGSSAQARLIIDCDTGVDDAQAIMIALSHHVKIEGITCVNGNCNVEQVIANTYKVLKVCNKLEIPIYRGARASLLGGIEGASYFHGTDGMGDLAEPISEIQDSIPCLQKKHAALAMIDIVNQYPGEVTLVALGPLTNVSLAIRMDPNFGDKLKEIFIMGGNIRGEGNHTPGAEFNFSQDPEAASITLTEIGCKIRLLPWDTCAKSGLEWEWFQKLIEEPTPYGYFNKAISSYNFKRRDEGDPFYIACDPAAMAAAINEDVVIETVRKYCCIELEGTLTRGQMVVDWNRLLKKDPNVDIVMAIDKEKLRDMYKVMISGDDA